MVISDNIEQLEQGLEVFHFTHQGKDRDSCKDIFSSYNLNNAYLVCLSDGVSSQEKSDVGALYVQQSVADMLSSIEDLNSIEGNELKFRIACTIKESIYKLRIKENCPKEKFASTYMSVLIPKNYNFFWTIHLGDGMICSLDNNKINIISYPQNGINKRYTYTTVSEDVYYRVRVQRHDLNLKSDIFVMTDGVSNEIFINDDILKDGYLNLLFNKNFSQFEKILNNKCPSDDIGFFAIY